MRAGMIESGDFEFGENAEPNQPHLQCPRCGGRFLHHHAVTLYDRAQDADNVTMTIVENGRIEQSVVDNGSSDNPSERRRGLVIRMFCESCSVGGDEDDVIELTIAQHKGLSRMGWRFTPRVPGERKPDFDAIFAALGMPKSTQ